MPIEAFTAEPPKVSIAKLSTGQSIDAQYNPTEFDEAVAANWGRLAIPGLSHQPMQFGYTENLKYDFTLNFSSGSGNAITQGAIENARRFLLSCVYPRSANVIRSGGAPRLLFIWPGMVAITCVMTSVKIKHQRFNKNAQTVQFSATIALEEIRDELLLDTDVETHGAKRSPGDPRAPHEKA